MLLAEVWTVTHFWEDATLLGKHPGLEGCSCRGWLDSWRCCRDQVLNQNRSSTSILQSHSFLTWSKINKECNLLISLIPWFCWYHLEYLGIGFWIYSWSQAYDNIQFPLLLSSSHKNEHSSLKRSHTSLSNSIGQRFFGGKGWGRWSIILSVTKNLVV